MKYVFSFLVVALAALIVALNLLVGFLSVEEQAYWFEFVIVKHGHIISSILLAISLTIFTSSIVSKLLDKRVR